MNSPAMHSLIDSLNTLIDSPSVSSSWMPQSPLSTFPRTPGNRKIFSAMAPNTFQSNANMQPRGPFAAKENMHPLHHNLNIASTDNCFESQPFKQKSRPISQPLPYPTWSDKLPVKDHQLAKDVKYSRKVFLGGVPWDITNEDLISTFGDFGHLTVEWPPTKNGQKPKGYVYIVFDEDNAVNKLLEFCRSYYAKVFRGVCDGTMYKYHVRSEKMKSKEIQVIPWNINDSTKVIGPQDKVNMHHQVFVGGLHGMLTATGLSKVMNDLFQNVVYVEIDTDKYKYPLGSGRVNFSSKESYHKAIEVKYVQVKCHSPKIDKRIQIDPYIRENESCSKCHEYPGPLYCRSCFDYFCDGCWDWHMRHSMKKHEWVSRQRNGKIV